MSASTPGLASLHSEIGGGSSGDRPNLGQGSTGESSPSLEEMQRQLRALEQELARHREKLESIAEVIGARDSSKIVHDVRNVMNELVLLRKLAELDE